MKYTLTHSKKTSAGPLYNLRDQYGAKVLCRNVGEVCDELAIEMTRVRRFCKRARSGEIVEFVI